MSKRNYKPLASQSKLHTTNRELPGASDPFGGSLAPMAPDPFGQYRDQLPDAPLFGTDYTNSLSTRPDPNSGDYTPQLPGGRDPYSSFLGALPGLPDMQPRMRPEAPPLPEYAPPEPEEHDIPTSGPRTHNPGFFT